MTSEPNTPGGLEGEALARGAGGADIARQLTGDLPCPVCRYNLRGLSVKSVCPECGTAVRAAILFAVDPYAPALQPFTTPRLTAAGIVLWSGGAALAALLTWGLRLCDLVYTVFEVPCPARQIARAALVCIFASGVGGIALIRPHARIPLLYSGAAAAGVACTFWLGSLYSHLHLSFDAVHVQPYFQQLSESLGARSLIRLEEGGLLLAIVLLFRPMTRLLAARSLLMRLGHADRQTMPMMAAAVCVAAVGDAANLISVRLWHPSELLRTLVMFPIVIGSMLLTVGLFGVLTDCVRICSVILRPPPAPADVLEPQACRAEGRA